MRLPKLAATGRGQQPAYRQIAAHLRSEIESGKILPGDRLPPIRSLASDIGVNRDTVALAYEELASAGLLESVVGRGTFVRGAAVGLAGAPLEVSLARNVENLLAIENARPRFAEGSDLIPLHSLVPDPAFYPVDAFRRCLNRVLSQGGAELLEYGAPQGHAGLREVIAARFEAAGCRPGADEIVLCHGASQGISLALRLFAQPGDAVAVELPTYHNLLSTLVALGLQAVPVPLGLDGPDLEQLERVLSRPEVKAFYTIPTFHNPMGTTTSTAARRQLLEVAGRCGTPVIEDGFEMDLRCVGRDVPPLAALDQRGLVVHLSSFSKSLFPGVRVGSITARGRVLEGLLALKHSTDLSDAMPLQAALEEFVRSGEYDRHLGRMRRMLRSRTRAMLAALESEMPDGSTWTEPEGGYQVWLELGFDVDTRDLLADAAREGVLFAPGSQFLTDRGPSRGLRLTLAQADEDEIQRGVEILGKVIRRRQKSAPTGLGASAVNM
ncbi:MAG: PLP-dependent aminotransferase family protein [Myxococcota bacterium]|nr:PLP-dependent aminotransferase family protein [Myxococcota bacterium]